MYSFHPLVPAIWSTLIPQFYNAYRGDGYPMIQLVPSDKEYNTLKRVNRFCTTGRSANAIQVWIEKVRNEKFEGREVMDTPWDGDPWSNCSKMVDGECSDSSESSKDSKSGDRNNVLGIKREDGVSI